MRNNTTFNIPRFIRTSPNPITFIRLKKDMDRDFSFKTLCLDKAWILYCNTRSKHGRFKGKPFYQSWVDTRSE